VLAGGLVLFLSLEAAVSRRDRIVILFVLCATYTFVLSGLRMVLLGGRAVWAHLLGRPTTGIGPLFPWELYLGLCGLLLNVFLAASGYKDVATREMTWPMHLGLPVAILGMGLLFGTLLLVFRRLPFVRWMEAPSWSPARNVVLGLLAVTLLAPDETPPSVVSASTLPVVPKQSHRPLVVVGVDGVDWQILRAAVATERLPHIKELLERGTTSSLDNEDYGFSPPVWTSIITGQPRRHHQIYDFVTRRSLLLERPLDAWWERIPPGFGIKSGFNALSRVGLVEEHLTNGAERRGPSLWQILSHFGYRSLVVNYLLANPPEEINGVFLAPGSPALQEAVVPLRAVSVGDLRGVKKQVLIEYELAVDEFARSAAVTLGILRAEHFDFVTFYTSWPDWFNHFMSLEDYDRVRAGHFEDGVPAALILAYERIDAFIGHVRSEEPDANIVLVSDHGVGLGYKFRRRRLQHVLGCPGIFVAQGPDVAASGPVPALTMYDLAPTVLGYFGVPQARDLPGRLRSDLFASAPIAQTVASYEAAIANRRRASGSEDLESVLLRLKALGYVQ
jgi:hypothetical protein